MMRKIWITLLLAVLLAGCSDTTVFIPEDDRLTDAGTVLYIPMNPESETEEETVPETTAPTEPTETEPEEKNTATVSKKTTGSSNKGTSTSSKNETTNKETVTGSVEPTVATEPIPELTEPPVTEPPVTEPPATEPPLYDISDYAVGDLEYAILDRINECRMEAGLEELWMDEYLCAIASCRAYEAGIVWSHTRPDGRGYGTVLADYGYGGGAAGELLGYSTGDGAAVADKWMASEPHRALLMGDSSAVGIGIYCAGGVTYVACLLIG